MSDKVPEQTVKVEALTLREFLSGKTLKQIKREREEARKRSEWEKDYDETQCKRKEMGDEAYIARIRQLEEEYGATEDCEDCGLDAEEQILGLCNSDLRIHLAEVEGEQEADKFRPLAEYDMDELMIRWFAWNHQWHLEGSRRLLHRHAMRIQRPDAQPNLRRARPPRGSVRAGQELHAMTAVAIQHCRLRSVSDTILSVTSAVPSGRA